MMISTMQTILAELPASVHDLDALLGFRFDIASGRTAIVNRTRAGSINHRPAAQFADMVSADNRASARLTLGE